MRVSDPVTQPHTMCIIQSCNVSRTGGAIGLAKRDVVEEAAKGPAPAAYIPPAVAATNAAAPPTAPPAATPATELAPPPAAIGAEKFPVVVFACVVLVKGVVGLFSS